MTYSTRRASFPAKLIFGIIVSIFFREAFPFDFDGGVSLICEANIIFNMFYIAIVFNGCNLLVWSLAVMRRRILPCAMKRDN